MENWGRQRPHPQVNQAPSVVSYLGRINLPSFSLVTALSLTMLGQSCQDYAGSSQALDYSPKEIAVAAETAARKKAAYQEAGRTLRQYALLNPEAAIEVAELNLESTPLLRDFYDKLDFLPVWSLESDHAQSLVKLLENAKAYGLEPNDYLTDPLLRRLELDVEELTPRARAERDLLLSDAYFRFGKHLKVGILPADSVRLAWRYREGSSLPKLAKRLSNGLAGTEKDFRTGLLGCQPNARPYQALQKATASFLIANAGQLDTLPPLGITSIPVWREDSATAYKLAAQILENKGLIDSVGLALDSGLIRVIQSFQLQHGLDADGRIGRRTAEALLMTDAQRYRSKALSLERWRHDHTWSDSCIYVNIPSYRLEVREGEQITKEFRVVVGAPEDATPEIESAIEYLVAYPFWNVPRSISTEEILPKQQVDSSYLARNRYSVFDRSGNEIDATQIDWSNVSASSFDYRFRQDGGSYNALGMLKFIFPNKHSVYIHDTNARQHFAKEDRALSHGCVRLENPTALATHLLEQDGARYAADSLEHWISTRKRQRIDLDKPVPIYIRYRTAAGDDEGRPIYYRDVYGLDLELEEALDSARSVWRIGAEEVLISMQ